MRSSPGTFEADYGPPHLIVERVAMRAEVLQADELATRAVARVPDWPRAWFCRGYVRLRQHRFTIAAFERASVA